MFSFSLSVLLKENRREIVNKLTPKMTFKVSDWLNLNEEADKTLKT